MTSVRIAPLQDSRSTRCPIGRLGAAHFGCPNSSYAACGILDVKHHLCRAQLRVALPPRTSSVQGHKLWPLRCMCICVCARHRRIRREGAKLVPPSCTLAPPGRSDRSVGFHRANLPSLPAPTPDCTPSRGVTWCLLESGRSAHARCSCSSQGREAPPFYIRTPEVLYFTFSHLITGLTGRQDPPR